MNSPEDYDPLPPGKIFKSELEKLYKEKFELLGATNKQEIFTHDKSRYKVSFTC